MKPFKCDMGPIFQVTFQVTYLNRKLTQFRYSEIQYQLSPNARNGSLGMRQPEMSLIPSVFDRLEINFDKRGFHQIPKLEILSLKSP